MKITYSDISINEEAVFRTMNCEPDSPVYDEVVQAYEELLPQVKSRVEATCLFGVGEITDGDRTEEYPAGTKVIYVISTLGQPLSSYSGELFEEGEYLKGVLVDAMADACLFGLESRWLEDLKAYCRTQKLGIKKRLEPPGEIPMTVQRTAWEYLRARQELGLEITSGYMYNPVKSACQVFVVSEDTCQFHVGHDCRGCPSVHCSNRHVEPVVVTICTSDKELTIACQEEESILAAYQRQVGYASAVCGGRGTCGKCRIQVVGGALAVTDGDRAVLTEEELAEGFRLSCRAYPKEDCTIRLCFQGEEAFQVLDQYGELAPEPAAEPSAEPVAVPGAQISGSDHPAGAGIAMDIGTTTLAAQLVDLGTGRILASAASVNHQRAFGADVISRMEASDSGKGAELQKIIRLDLDGLAEKLLRQSQIAPEQVKKVIVAGNTVMSHLLMGYSCKTLGVYPFSPVNIKTIHGSYGDILGTERFAADTWIFPGFSAYVGGDITSGLYACGLERSREIKLFVDLGTNGEMALGNQERLITASVAAGPAFEGGNISCGVGSIPGAVSHVRIARDGQVMVETIQNQPPVGICGTGVIELTAELLRNGLVDETGRMEEPYARNGFPIAKTKEGMTMFMTQKDIRELQLAKAAVRAGVETLIKRYGIGYEDISQVLLAGGMGFQLDREAAAAVGLLPEGLKEKVIAVGNSSLAGCVRALGDDAWQERAEGIVSRSRELALAADEFFGASYIENMMFPFE